MAIKRPKGSKHHNTTLRECDVMDIRARFAAGEKQKALCEEFNLSPAACSNIINRKTWKHLSESSGITVVYADMYHIWKSMLGRCHNPEHPAYEDYGKRGILVHPDWHVFATFLKDIGVRPSKGHSVDRKEVLQGYSKDNCRWATDKVQARNKRGTVYLNHPTTGEKIAAADLAEEQGIEYRKFRLQLIAEGRWPTKPPKEM